MPIDDLMAMVVQQGFPVAMAVYLLVRMEGRLSELTTAINELRLSIEKKEPKP